MGKRKQITPAGKKLIGATCINCGSSDDIVYHHVVPLAFGGRDVITNIVPLCDNCHKMVHYGKKGEISTSEAIKRGLEKAKKNGKKLGAASFDGEKIKRMIAENSSQFNEIPTKTEHEIMDEAGVKPTAYNKYKKRLLALMQSEEWPFKWEKPKQIRKIAMAEAKILMMRGVKHQSQAPWWDRIK